LLFLMKKVWLFGWASHIICIQLARQHKTVTRQILIAYRFPISKENIPLFLENWFMGQWCICYILS